MPELGQNPTPENEGQPVGPSEAQKSYADLGQPEAPQSGIIDSIPDFKPAIDADIDAAKGPQYETAEVKNRPAPEFSEGSIVAIRRSKDSKFVTREAQQGALELDWVVDRTEDGKIVVVKTQDDGQVVERTYTPTQLAEIQLREVKFVPNQRVRYHSDKDPDASWVVLNQASNGNVRIVVDTEDTDRMLHRWISGAELEAIQQQPPVQPSTETVAKPITVVEGAQDPVPEPPKRRGFFGRGK